MPFASLCAMLEDLGYRRDEIRHLTRRYVVEVLQHDRDRQTGRLVIEYRQSTQANPLSEIRSRLRRLNYPEHLIETKARQILGARMTAEMQDFTAQLKKSR